MLNVDYRALPEIACPVCGATAYSLLTTRFDAGRLVRCAGCGHVYLNPPLASAQLDAIYGAYNVSDDDAAWMATIDGWFHDPAGPYQYALALVEGQGGFGGKRVLEVGCGPGRFLHECQTRGAQVTGLDLSPHAIALARRTFGLDVIPASLEAAVAAGRLRAAQFDLIFLFEVIEHVQKPGEFVRLLHGLLVPEGLLVLSTPNFTLFYLMGSAAPVVSRWQEHLHFFDAATLGDLLRRGGFELVATRTTGAVTPAARQKQKLLRWAGVRRAWQGVRRVPLALRLKEAIFRRVDRRQTGADAAGQTGECLVCMARRPAETATPA